MAILVSAGFFNARPTNPETAVGAAIVSLARLRIGEADDDFEDRAPEIDELGRLHERAHEANFCRQFYLLFTENV